MSIQPWKKLSEVSVAVNPWWTYRKAACETPSGVTGEYHYAACTGGAMVIPIRADGRIGMVRQYRLTLDEVTLEFPAGCLQTEKTFEATALAELTEEIGMAARQIEKVGTFSGSTGLSNDRGQAFVAWDLYPCSNPGDDTEDIEVVWHTAAEIEALIAAGDLTSGWTLATWMLGRARTYQIIAEKIANPS